MISKLPSFLRASTALTRPPASPRASAAPTSSGQVDGYIPGHLPLNAAAFKPSHSPSSPSLLSKLGLSLGLIAAPAAIPGPAGLGVGLSLEALRAAAQKTTLEDKNVLMGALDRATAQMSQTGGIVSLPKGVPTMVLPDMHAQRDYLMHALEHKVGGEKVFDLLKQGKMNLLILGDGMHSEARGHERWLIAEDDHLSGLTNSPAMKDEVVESFGTMKMVMDLKEELGDHLVYLRGNHDDIKGNYRKYCDEVGESELMRSWVTNNYGPDLVDKWAAFEQSMPLVARGTGFVASHAAPGAPLQRQEIEQRSDRAFQVLAWTDNTKWDEGSSKRAVFESNRQAVEASPFDRWLVGHRKVSGANFRGQFDQALVQINPTDAEGYVVAMVGADGAFDPRRDTFKL